MKKTPNRIEAVRSLAKLSTKLDHFVEPSISALYLTWLR
jgi:hypothetical protein